MHDQGAVDIFYHGEDDRCLLPFLRRYDLIDRFNSCVINMFNTQEFYKVVEANKFPPSRKFGMRAIVSDWATPEVQEIYNKGAHGALVDALVLGFISCGQALGQRFSNFFFMN